MTQCSSYRQTVIRERIFEANGALPVKVVWRRGTTFKTPILASHSAWEFQFIKQGYGIYLIDGQRHCFRNNSLLTIRSNRLHVFVPSSDVLTVKATLQFAPELFDRLGHKDLALTFSDHVVLRARAATQVELILNQIQDELRQQDPYRRDMVLLKIREFFYTAKRAELPQALESRPPAVISSLLDYLETSFHQPLPISRIVERFGFSESHLAHLFKQQTGMAIKQYLLQRRIIEAKRRLESDPMLKVDAVAQQVGFDDFSAFNRMFKKRAGMTPSAYRRIVHLDRGKRYTAQ